jgi:DNA repair ATPase RecN
MKHEKLSDCVKQMENIAEEVKKTLNSTHMAKDIKQVAEKLKELLRMEDKYGK